MDWASLSEHSIISNANLNAHRHNKTQCGAPHNEQTPHSSGPRCPNRLFDFRRDLYDNSERDPIIPRTVGISPTAV